MHIGTSTTGTSAAMWSSPCRSALKGFPSDFEFGRPASLGIRAWSYTAARQRTYPTRCRTGRGLPAPAHSGCPVLRSGCRTGEQPWTGHRRWVSAPPVRVSDRARTAGTCTSRVTGPPSCSPPPRPPYRRRDWRSQHQHRPLRRGGRRRGRPRGCGQEGGDDADALPPDWANYGEIIPDFEASTASRYRHSRQRVLRASSYLNALA